MEVCDRVHCEQVVSVVQEHDSLPASSPSPIEIVFSSGYWDYRNDWVLLDRYLIFGVGDLIVCISC